VDLMDHAGRVAHNSTGPTATIEAVNSSVPCTGQFQLLVTCPCPSRAAPPASTDAFTSGNAVL
jgi:hypothetical protein